MKYEPSIGPNEQFSENALELRVSVVALVSVLTRKSTKQSEALLEKACNVESIIGNRPHNALVTWQDERLILACALRVCLEELEAT